MSTTVTLTGLLPLVVLVATALAFPVCFSCSSCTGDPSRKEWHRSVAVNQQVANPPQPRAYHHRSLTYWLWVTRYEVRGICKRRRIGALCMGHGTHPLYMPSQDSLTRW